MMGKTHVVNSLAIVNTGLVGYTAYTTYNAGLNESVLKKPLAFFDLALTGPVTFLGYTFFLATILFFVLFIFRKPSRKKAKKEKFFYVLMMIVSLFLLYFFFESLFVFKLTLAFLVFIFGVLLPDIDSKSSTLGRYVTPISANIPHRTITHTVWVVGLLLALGLYFKNGYVLMLTLGYTLHMLQDTFSACGICWLYPIIGSYTNYSGGAVVKKGRNKTFSYKVGGMGETIIFWVSIVVIVLSVILFYYILFEYAVY